MKIIVSGVCGRMGANVVKLAASGCRNSQIACGKDIVLPQNADFPCYTDWNEIKEDADCIVDFSFHAGTPEMLLWAQKKNIPVVLCTTGHTEDELKAVEEASKNIPIFRSANMSIGVALLVELAKKTAKAMPGAEIEIIEKHHDRKLDAPSGTALMLAEAIKKVRENAPFVFGRHGQAKRTKEEIGIHSIRMGNIVGEHEVIIGTDNETITLKHEAHDRALFAEGALAAAEFIIGKPAGMYSMQDMTAND